MRAFWPLYSIVLASVGFYFLGILDSLSIETIWIVVLLLGVATCWAAYRALRFLAFPKMIDAERKVDQALRNHPISVLRETGYVGSDHQDASNLWAVHMDQMRNEAQMATPQPIDFRLSRMDPFGLRYIALLFATLGVMFGSLSRVAELAVSPAQAMQMQNAITWEGWITPPDYTGLPQLYLNDLVDQDELALLEGSRVLVHFYGAIGDHLLNETVSRRVQNIPAATDQKQEFSVAQAGEIAITGNDEQSWSVVLRQDASPTVTLNDAFDTDFFGVSKLGYRVVDDYGVTGIKAQVVLDLAKLDRKYGLAVAPDTMDDLPAWTPWFVQAVTSSTTS